MLKLVKHPTHRHCVRQSIDERERDVHMIHDGAWDNRLNSGKEQAARWEREDSPRFVSRLKIGE